MKQLMGSFFVLLIAFATYANAESPRAEFKQAVELFQKTPNDDALRERIIKLAQELKPAPAIPEEARRAFVRGTAALSDAKVQDDYARAQQRYEEALVIAPWWGDPYFNLAKAQELQNDFGGAVRSLKFYLLTNVPADEARKTQDYIYVLEDKQDKITREKAEQQAAAEKKAQAERVLDNFKGTWYGRNCYVGQYTVESVNRGCNENEANGSNWHVFNLGNGALPLTFEFPGDGTVKLNGYTGWAGCGDVFGVPQGPSFTDIRWEERPKDGPARQVYVDISYGGDWLKISCGRPLSGVSPNDAFRYVIWSRNP